jgi:uncharacterized cupredoxin-like copper-binding protein
MRLHLHFMIGAAMLAPAGASAHEATTPHAKPRVSTERYPWGRAADPAQASATIAVEMADTMRFTPERLVVRQGDTVKFVVRNRGKLMHEMVLGTEAALREHAELMKKHPGMEHEEPYMAHVSPGKSETLAWTFTEPGTFMYGCLVPGHWEAGMKGTIVVNPRSPAKGKP